MRVTTLPGMRLILDLDLDSLNGYVPAEVGGSCATRLGRPQSFHWTSACCTVCRTRNIEQSERFESSDRQRLLIL